MSEASTDETLLTVAEVAELLKVHKETVLRHARAGNLKSYKIGRALRFTKQQVTEFLKPQQGE
jgi:excisionase family DNA binding protein